MVNKSIKHYVGKILLEDLFIFTKIYFYKI